MITSSISNELSLLRQLTNPYIVQFIDLFQNDITFCLVTEYCEVSKLVINKKIQIRTIILTIHSFKK
jgi:serine/threonine protein kinase